MSKLRVSKDICLDEQLEVGMDKDDLLRLVKDLEEADIDGKFLISMFHSYSESQVIATITRWETDEEEQERLMKREAAEKKAAKKREQEYQKYLKLKEQFEGDH